MGSDFPAVGVETIGPVTVRPKTPAVTVLLANLNGPLDTRKLCRHLVFVLWFAFDTAFAHEETAPHLLDSRSRRVLVRSVRQVPLGLRKSLLR